MEISRLLECLAVDYARLDGLAADDLRAAVPHCPGWTVADLTRHVAEVYLHKVEAMRSGRRPSPWPPPDLAAEDPVALLRRAHGALLAEFSQRTPDDPAFTFYRPQQNVAFWIRRMAQETLIHRVDAEQALGVELDKIPTDLALDGIDEILHVFLAYGSESWPQAFAPTLETLTPFTVDVVTDGAAWQVAADRTGVRLTDGADGADAVLSGPPDSLLLHLWNRADGATVTGSADAAASLRTLLAVATQ